MDQKTMAYVNLCAVLGSLVELCEIDAEAKKIIDGKNVSVGFAVKGGPSGTLKFENGKCAFLPGSENCAIKLPFSSCERFNGMVNGTVTPIPSKGFTKIGFLLHDFTKLTDILTKYLRAGEADLADGEFFAKSTVLMFRLITAAVAQVGNEDKIGRASASYITDGCVRLSIVGGPSAALRAEGHKLTALREAPEDCTSYMEFCDMKTARDLFDGRINAVSAVGLGKVRVGGMVSQVDNVNRIMDRIPVYLA